MSMDLPLPMDTPLPSRQRIYASFVKFLGRQYICGLSLRRHAEKGETIASDTTTSEVGMRVAASEDHFDTNAGDVLQGLRIIEPWTVCLVSNSGTEGKTRTPPRAAGLACVMGPTLSSSPVPWKRYSGSRSASMYVTHPHYGILTD